LRTHDNDSNSEASSALNKQADNIKKLLVLERQTDWKLKEGKGFNFYFKTFDNGKFIAKTACEFDGDYKDLHNFIKDNVGTKKFSPGTKEYLILKQYKSDLKEVYRLFNTDIIDDREFVSIDYAELLEEERFGCVYYSSIERNDIPVKKGCVRGEIFGGFIIRGISENRTAVSNLLHIDARGYTKLIPKKLLKHMAFKDAPTFIEIISKEFPQTNPTMQNNNNNNNNNSK